MERMDANALLFTWVESPITPKQLSEINSSLGRVQFGAALTESDHKKLAEWLRKFPDVSLRVYESFGAPERDLDFLRHYKGLKRLSVDLYHLQSLDGLYHIADSLEYFGFGQTKEKVSVEFLAEFGRLKGLALDGHELGIEAISNLKKMEELTLRSITLPDLEIIANLPKLWSLDLILGGTKNLAALARIRSLKNLELCLVKKLSDISVLSAVTSLQRVKLHSLRNVTAIPDLCKLKKLRRVSFQNMKGIKDLSALLGAKSLEDICITQGSQLQPEAFQPLQKHPSLKAIGFGLGSDKKNQAVAAMFPQLQHTIKYPFVYR